jgi:hypothetical protein
MQCVEMGVNSYSSPSFVSCLYTTKLLYITITVPPTLLYLATASMQVSDVPSNLRFSSSGATCLRDKLAITCLIMASSSANGYNIFGVPWWERYMKDFGFRWKRLFISRPPTLWKCLHLSNHFSMFNWFLWRSHCNLMHKAPLQWAMQ